MCCHEVAALKYQTALWNSVRLKVTPPPGGETNTPARGYLFSIQKFQGGVMQGKRRSLVLIVTGVLNILMGLALAVGGVWLIALGGSWYYAIAAVALLLTGFLLIAARPAALLVYALLGAGTGATHEIIQPEERACSRHSRRPACDAPAC